MAVTIMLTVEAGCEFESAAVTYVPPASVRVVQTEQCGPITCWSRYLLFEGRRLGESRACESGHSMAQSGSPIRVVPSPAEEPLP